MAKHELDQQIKSRIDTFVHDVSGLLRKAALEAVREALETGAPGVRRRGPGRPPGATASAAPGRKPAAAKKAKKKGGKRIRRSGEALEKMQERLRSELAKSKEGMRMEELTAVLGMSAEQVRLPLQKMVANKELKTKGQRRAMTYSLK